jgi:hypothetical protein
MFWIAVELPSTETSPVAGAAYPTPTPEISKDSMSKYAKPRLKTEF